MTTIAHREFLTDIIGGNLSGGSSEFKNQSFIVQPGNSATFPWGSTIAQNFEQYYVHAIQFFFRSSAGDNTTTGAAGNVILAMEYNVNSTPYPNKQYMENSAGGRSTKQQNSLGITAKIVDRILFTRTGAIPTGDSLKFYDHSIFQIATQGFPVPNFNAGELWVAYKITFLKPQIPRTLGGNIESFAATIPFALTGDIFGDLNLSTPQTRGSIDVRRINANQLNLFGLIVGNIYYVNCYWEFGEPHTPTPTITVTNSTEVLVYDDFTSAAKTSGFGVVSAPSCQATRFFRASKDNAVIQGGGNLGPSSCNLLLQEVDQSIGTIPI